MRGRNDRRDEKSESDADVEVDAAVLICEILELMPMLELTLVFEFMIYMQDTDECAVGTHNCGALGPGYLCRNIQV